MTQFQINPRDLRLSSESAIETDRRDVVRRMRRENPKPSTFGQELVAGIRVESVIPTLVNKFQDNSYRVDPKYGGAFADEDEFNNLTKDLQPIYHEAFLYAKSAEHAQLVRERMLEVQEANDILHNAGWSGLGARVIAGIADPVMLAADLASGGLARGFIVGGKATRLARFTRAGMIAGGENVAIEAFVGSDDPSRGTADLVFAGIGGFGLGGLFGLPVKRTPISQSFLRVQEAQLSGNKVVIDGDVLVKKGGEVTPAGKAVQAQGEARLAELQPQIDARNAVRKLQKAAEYEEIVEAAPDAETLDQMITDKGVDYFAEIADPEEILQARIKIAELQGLEGDDFDTFSGGSPRGVAGAGSLPRTVQRIEEPGVAVDLDKPQGLFTSPADADSPHADLGGERTTFNVNQDANTLRIDASASIETNRGVVGKSAGMAALEEFSGAAEASRIASLSRKKAIAEAEAAHPDTNVNWERYADAQEIAEARAGIMAKEKGFDAIFAPDATDPNFTEFVALTKNAFSDDATEVTPPLTNRQALAQAAERIPDILHNGPDLSFRDTTGTRAEKVFGFPRFGNAWTLGKSDSVAVRKVGQMQFQDVILRNGEPAREAASEWVALEQGKWLGQRFYTSYMPALKAHMKAEGIKRVGEAKSKFNTLMANGVRGEPVPDYMKPAIAEYSKMMADFKNGIMERYGVFEAGLIPDNDNYVMRMLDIRKFRRHVDEVGMDGVASVFAHALRVNNAGLDEAASMKWAKGYVRVVLQLEKADSFRASQLMQPSQIDAVRARLQEEPDLSVDEVENILYDLVDKPAKLAESKNVDPRAMIRNNFAELAKEPNTNLRPVDFFDNDIERITHRYVRHGLGAAASKQIYNDMAFHLGMDEGTINNLDQLVGAVRKHAIDNEGHELTKLEENTIRFGERFIRGQRLDQATGEQTSKILRIARAANFALYAQQFGFAQIPEAGNLVAGVGIRNLILQMPAMRSIIRSAKGGKLHFDNELLESIAQFHGAQNDYLTHQVVNGVDMDGSSLENIGGTATKTDRLLHIGNQAERITSVLSGLTAVDGFLMRSAMLGSYQKWASIAKSVTPEELAAGKGFSNNRLAAMGLAPEEGVNILKMAKHYATFAESNGSRLVNMNIDKWMLDPDKILSANQGAFAASKFIAANERWATTMIQRPDPGQMALFMSNEWAKIVLQFRSFVISAYEKQLLHKLQMRDTEALISAGLASMFAGLAYTAQTYTNSIGRPDQDEYLKKRLSTAEIAKAAFYRAGYASFMPTLFDTGTSFLGIDPLFNNSRNTGMASNLILGNPTTDLFNSLQASTSTLSTALASGGETVDQREAEKVRKLLWLNKIAGINQFANATVGQFPEPE